MRRYPWLLLLLVAVTGCGGGSGGPGGQICTEIGAPPGIGVDVAAPIAEQVTGGTLQVCWDGECVQRDLQLRPSTEAGETTCTGDGPEDNCSAQVSENGRKNAFADLRDLPQAPVRATLTLTGADGQVVRQELEVTPELTYPNGTECPPGGVQAHLVVDESGSVQERD
ncbi:hypothetical protein SAMN05216266_10191 [Amycolatopsis marina]|uniref:Uncharacterized protein n=1 Tax=Amycolatopsis marina TaxID=490629 RepID=A0A1I0VA17_9PSEU|nr:hypothetical protein [Amycolatopsis marina]SFA72897.1 hypothetical protein SAMN05216266_10191 [Amycolatopsis marina]